MHVENKKVLFELGFIFLFFIYLFVYFGYSNSIIVFNEKKEFLDSSYEVNTHNTSVFSVHQSDVLMNNVVVSKFGDTNFYFSALNSALKVFDQSLVRVSGSSISTYSSYANALWVQNSVASFVGDIVSMDHSLVYLNDVTMIGSGFSTSLFQNFDSIMHVVDSFFYQLDDVSFISYINGDVVVLDSRFDSHGMGFFVEDGSSLEFMNDVFSISHTGFVVQANLLNGLLPKRTYIVLDGGRFEVENGYLFDIFTPNVVIQLRGVDVQNVSDLLSISNETLVSGKVQVDTFEQYLEGNISIFRSDFELNLIHSFYKGKIVSDQIVDVFLDHSTWVLTGDQIVNRLSIVDADLSLIEDCGYSLYYNSSLVENAWLGGKIYDLQNGGKLMPF